MTRQPATDNRQTTTDKHDNTTTHDTGRLDNSTAATTNFKLANSQLANNVVGCVGQATSDELRRPVYTLYPASFASRSSFESLLRCRGVAVSVCGRPGRHPSSPALTVVVVDGRRWSSPSPLSSLVAGVCWCVVVAVVISSLEVDGCGFLWLSSASAANHPLSAVGAVAVTGRPSNVQWSWSRVIVVSVVVMLVSLSWRAPALSVGWCEIRDHHVSSEQSVGLKSSATTVTITRVEKQTGNVETCY